MYCDVDSTERTVSALRLCDAHENKLGAMIAGDLEWALPEVDSGRVRTPTVCPGTALVDG